MDKFTQMVWKFTAIFGMLFFIMLSALPGTSYAAEAEAPKQESKLEAFAVEKLEKYVNGFEELTKQYAPEAVDAGLKVVTFNALRELVPAFLWLIVAVFVYRWCIKFHENWDGYEFPPHFLAGAVAALPTIFAVFAVVDVWNWVAVFEPKLYIAYRVFEKLL